MYRPRRYYAGEVFRSIKVAEAEILGSMATLYGLQGVHHAARGLQRAHRNDSEKSVLKTFFFFFEITSKSGGKCGIFLFCFGVHKSGDAYYLS